MLSIYLYQDEYFFFDVEFHALEADVMHLSLDSDHVLLTILNVAYFTSHLCSSFLLFTFNAASLAI